jgi:hypothetical protein
VPSTARAVPSMDPHRATGGTDRATHGTQGLFLFSIGSLFYVLRDPPRRHRRCVKRSTSSAERSSLTVSELFEAELRQRAARAERERDLMQIKYDKLAGCLTNALPRWTRSLASLANCAVSQLHEQRRRAGDNVMTDKPKPPRGPSPPKPPLPKPPSAPPPKPP